jgi:hypothetical protein
MRVFGTKHVEPTDEDRVAAARLSAVAARFKGEPAADFTEVEPDPLGEPEAVADEPEASDEVPEAAEAPEQPDDDEDEQ